MSAPALAVLNAVSFHRTESPRSSSMSPFFRSAFCLGLFASLACLQTGARPSAQTLWTCEADIVFEGAVELDHRGWGLDTSGNWNSDAYAGGQPMQDILAGGFQTEC